MKIAILDDDLTHTQLIEQALTGGSDDAWSTTLHCETFTNSRKLLDALDQQTFDCLILDRKLPDISGDDLLQHIRKHSPSDTVVIIVSSLAGAEHSAALLAAGADDYITKPFHGAELYARVQRLLSRRIFTQNAAVEEVPNIFSLYDAHFDRIHLSITRLGVKTFFTGREFALAEFLFRHAEQPLSRAEIYSKVWHRPAVNTSRAVDTLIHRIRTKLQLEAQHGFVLQPIYGFGYRLNVLGSSS